MSFSGQQIAVNNLPQAISSQKAPSRRATPSGLQQRRKVPAVGRHIPDRVAVRLAVLKISISHWLAAEY